MKLATCVLLAFVAAAAAGEVETVTEHFASAPGMAKARVVQSVKVFLNPESVVKAKIVKHLPSHQKADADSEEEGESRITGNVFETSNFEADQVLETDAESLESTTMVEADDADAMRFRAGASAPIQKLKQLLVKAQLPEVPGMLPVAPGTPNDANAAVDAVDPTSPAALNAQKQPEQVLDAAAVRANGLYLGHEDPNKLPDGTEIKRPVDTSGTIGTPAGTDFDFNKKANPKKKCSNGCQVQLPVMVGYVGVPGGEQPARSTREVRMPGDHERNRAIHEDYKVPARHLWHPTDIVAGRKHLARASTKIEKLITKRKAYEDTALNREVRVPLHRGLVA